MNRLNSITTDSITKKNNSQSERSESRLAGTSEVSSEGGCASGAEGSHVRPSTSLTKSVRCAQRDWDVRNPFSILLVTLILFALTSFSLLAQERALTIEESIALGLENSKILHSSLMKAEYADAKSGEASALLYPSLKFQAAYQKLSEVPEFKIPLPG
ncbi:MAG: hypothetical protein HY089_11920, partial [Ignavibacteriales bacterium]|nr:hypothetical protein [Ignavibacteriales bacterium]